MSVPVRRTLEGEVLGAKDSVRVVGRPHPFRAERFVTYLPAGLSVAEMMALVRARHPTRLARRLVVRLEGDPIPEGMWSSVRPKKGVTLTFTAVPEGGAAGGADPKRSIAFIAVAAAALIFTLVIAPYLALPTIAASLIGAAITVGGALLVNALFPVPKPQLNQEEAQARYSIGNASNEAKPYGTIPVILGEHRMAPLYASRPYTEIIGDDQYLRVVLCWGYGRLELDQFKIGETDIGDFDGVSIEHKLGTASDTNLTLFPREVFEEQLSIELEDTTFHERTTEDDIDEISLDIAFPNGLFSVGGKTGVQYPYSVNVIIDYKRTSASTWTRFGTMTISDNQRSSVRRGFRIPVSVRDQYDVRVARQKPKYVDTVHIEIGTQVTEDVFWIALRGMRKEDPTQFATPLAYTALRIKATSQLNGTLSNFTGRVRSRCLHYNGAGWIANTMTSNPGDLIRYVLQHPANKRPVPDAKLDLPAFQGFVNYCANRGFTFNQVRGNAASVYSTVQDIAAAGRGVVLFHDGKWSVTWDELDLPIVQHFSPRNSWDFKAVRAYRRMPHGFRVSFLNKAKNYEQDERIVYDGGYSAANATDFESLEFPGVTDANLIWKHGRFHIAQARLRPERYTLETDFENLVCTRGDRVRVQHDVPLWGQISARVKEVSGSTITLDETVIMESGVTYSARFRGADGVSLLISGFSGGGETNTLTTAFTPKPAVGDLMSWGETNLETVILRVLSIAPGDNLTATLELVDDAPAISTADTSAIPDFDSHISDPVDPLTMAPAAVIITEYLHSTDSGIIAGAIITWQVARIGAAVSYEVQVRDEGTDQIWKTVGVVPAPQTAYLIPELSTGTYSFRVRALFQGGGFSGWTEKTFVVFLGLMRPPPDVTGFRIASLGDFSTLVWDPITVLNFSHYIIKFSPLVSGVTWGSSTTLVAQAIGSQVQVPSQVGTYLIRGVTRQAVMSDNATIITSDVAAVTALNVVEELQENPTFPGTKTGVVVLGSELHLGTSETMDDWTSLSDVDSLYLGTSGILDEGGIYEFNDGIDLGAIFTSRITPTVDAYGQALGETMSKWLSLASIEKLNPTDPSQWEVTVQYRATDDNPAGSPTWTNWIDLSIGDYTARAFEFRALLEGDESRTVAPAVRQLTINVDMPDRIEGNSDVAVTSAGLRIDFDPAYKELRGVGIAAQGLATGDYYTKTLQDETGFTIRFFNASNTAIAKTFDWVSKGWGRNLS